MKSKDILFKPKTGPDVPELGSFESDPVWDLLDSGTTTSPASNFTQNVVRAARLQKQPSFRDRLACLLDRRAILLGSAAAALGLFALTQFSGLQAPPTSPSLGMTPVLKGPAPAPTPHLNEALAGELLVAASVDPELLSDQEVIALLF